MEQIEVGSTDLIVSDSGSIYDATIGALEQAVAEPLYPGDERRIFGEGMAAVLSRVHGTIQDAAQQVMLRYARGEVLDALGARLRVLRLDGDAARTVLRFTLGAPQALSVAIPEGTKATPDGSVYFATDETAVIEPGATSVDVPASCTEVGAAANGYGTDAITTMVDLIPYVSKVTNVTTSEGGDDGEPYTVAGDDRFRERILLAPSHLSTAGPEKGYVYYAKSADAGISDVAAMSETEWMSRELPVSAGRAYIGGELLIPETLTINGQADGFECDYEDHLLTIRLGPELAEAETVLARWQHKMDGRVRIIVLMEGGGYPDEDTLEKVRAAVSASDVRPLTDVVDVDGPELVPYDIELEYWTTPEDEATVVRSVEGAGGAIERYIYEQGSVLGRNINPDMLESYIMRPDWDDALKGAIRVDMTSPQHLELEGDEAACFSGNIKVTHHVTTKARWSTWT